jgi:hypothetical protein
LSDTQRPFQDQQYAFTVKHGCGKQ